MFLSTAVCEPRLTVLSPSCLYGPYAVLLCCVQDDDGAETRVVQLLGLDHWELAKELMKNKLKIVWVTKLKQAQNEEEVRSAVGHCVKSPCWKQVPVFIVSGQMGWRGQESADTQMVMVGVHPTCGLCSD